MLAGQTDSSSLPMTELEVSKRKTINCKKSEANE